MDMNVYECEECSIAFAVEEGEDVQCCPSCHSVLFEFSHDVIAVQKIKRPVTGQCEQVS